MTEIYDVIVVGVGAMGASACHCLAQRGVRVLGLEQFDVPHGLGSSTGFSRMIRMAYYEHPNYVPLLRRSYELWHELEAASAQKLLYQTGGIYLGTPDGELVAGSIGSARQHNLQHEVLNRQQLAERFSQFTVPDNWAGVYEPTAGFLVPEKVIATYADQAMRLGAEIHGHEPVIEWHAGAEDVAVLTAKGSYSAKKLIFCGGAWSGSLLRDIGVHLSVTRQVLGWVWPRRPEIFSIERFPVWAIGNDDGSLYYGFPMMPDNPGLKIARHAPGRPTDADHVDRNVLPGDEETFRAGLSSYLPQGDGPLLSLRTCLYTNSPDHHFIIDQHPHHHRVSIACGFSGHGFKFASVIGELLADRAMNGKATPHADFLGLSRFALSGAARVKLE